MKIFYTSAILQGYKDMFVTILHAEDVLSQAAVV
jgi:hypothetical protein